MPGTENLKQSVLIISSVPLPTELLSELASSKMGTIDVKNVKMKIKL